MELSTPARNVTIIEEFLSRVIPAGVNFLSVCGFPALLSEEGELYTTVLRYQSATETAIKHNEIRGIKQIRVSAGVTSFDPAILLFHGLLSSLNNLDLAIFSQ